VYDFYTNNNNNNNNNNHYTVLTVLQAAASAGLLSSEIPTFPVDIDICEVLGYNFYLLHPALLDVSVISYVG